MWQAHSFLLYQKWNDTLTFSGDTKKYQSVVQLVRKFFFGLFNDTFVQRKQRETYVTLP